MHLYEVTCPSCGKLGWVNDGGSDETSPVPESAVCWNCYHCFFIEDEEDMKAMYGDEVSPDNCITEFAHKTATHAATPCWIIGYSSGVCSRGTRGCERNHRECSTN